MIKLNLTLNSYLLCKQNYKQKDQNSFQYENYHVGFKK